MKLPRGDHAAFSAHLCCLLPWLLYVLDIAVAEDLSLISTTTTVSPREDIPVIYRAFCGEDLYCDNRTEYCDKTMITTCNPCSDICGKNVPYIPCQKRCKGYLQYNLEQEKEQRLLKKMNKIVASRIEPLLDRLAAAQDKVNDLETGHTKLMVIVILGALLCLVGVCILVKVVHRVHQPQGGPYRQTTPYTETTPGYFPVISTELAQNVENESGLGTTNVTPENRRRSQADIESGERPQTFITTPTQDA